MHLSTGTEVLTAAYETARMSTDHNKQLLLHCRVWEGPCYKGLASTASAAGPHISGPTTRRVYTRATASA